MIMANVKFEYLFLDIEWNQAPKTTDIEEREPVQIGIVAADANLNIKRTFSKSIRLSNRECFNQNTFTVSHYPLDAIMKSKSEETVLKNMNISFQNYKYIVVWTNETYELLKRRTDKYGISMPRHRVIILQQLLMQIAGDGKKVIGFEKSLKQAGIKYQKNYLHYSKHDVNYLYLLFCKCYGEYRKLTEQETCYLNPRTHKVHNGNCRYADSALIKSSKDVIFQGNKVCKVCGCENDWNRFHWKTNIKIKRKYNIKDIRDLPLTIENLNRICDIFNLEYSVTNDAVFIKTPFGRWIVYLKGDEVKELHHENYRSRRGEPLNAHKKCIDGYHKQKLVSNNFYDVIYYINCHDSAMTRRWKEKSRIEKLFEMIDNQRIQYAKN